jgi:hypothetical protein
MSLRRTNIMPGPWNYCPLVNSSSLIPSFHCLRNIKCARDACWKDIALGVVYTIILPVGLVYFCASSIYCLVKKCPMKLIFFPFMRQAAFSAQSAPTKKESPPIETQHVAPNLPPAIEPSFLHPEFPPAEEAPSLIAENQSPATEDPSPIADPHIIPPPPPQPPLEPHPVVDPTVDPVVAPIPPAKIGAGIPNLGATCYMNASLQVLYRCEPFSAAIRSLCMALKGNADFDVICHLGEIFEYLADPKIDGDRTQPCPLELIENFFTALNASGAWKHPPNESCDAQEFMTTFLDYVQTRIGKLTQGQANDSVDKAKSAGTMTDDEVSALRLARFYQPNRSAKTSVAVDFGFSSSWGTLGQEVVAGQPIGDQFEVHEDPVTFVGASMETRSFQETLNSLAAPETVELALPAGRRGHAELRKKIVTLPAILPIHIMRFKSSKIDVQKINDRFEFPDGIDLAPFTPYPDGSASYELSSIVAHGGTGDSGHYAMYAKIGGRWYKFNDSGVQEVSNSEIKYLYGGKAGEANAYMLFYKKTT